MHNTETSPPPPDDHAPACSGPPAIDRFSFGQKLFIRICLYGFGAVGIAGAFTAGLSAGLAVLAVSALAGFVVLRCFCSHCPYPHRYDTCYAMPPIVIRTVTRRRPGPLSAVEKTLFLSALAAAILLPQVWLIRRPAFLIAYWAFCLPTCVVFPFYVCRRCRFENCPFNRRTAT